MAIAAATPIDITILRLLECRRAAHDGALRGGRLGGRRAFCCGPAAVAAAPDEDADAEDRAKIGGSQTLASLRLFSSVSMSRRNSRSTPRSWRRMVLACSRNWAVSRDLGRREGHAALPGLFEGGDVLFGVLEQGFEAFLFLVEPVAGGLAQIVDALHRAGGARARAQGHQGLVAAEIVEGVEDEGGVVGGRRASSAGSRRKHPRTRRRRRR